MVTHNIEEAVFMCDRIVVLSSNPGRVIAEIKVDLPHPRNRVDPAFPGLVDDIYTRMTMREPSTHPKDGLFPGTGIGMVLPRVSSNALSGLMETLFAYDEHSQCSASTIRDKDMARYCRLFAKEKCSHGSRTGAPMDRSGRAFGSP
jgi:NitT/TauT family transport system ATP-binding protein